FRGEGELEALAVHPLAQQLARPANGLGLFASPLLRRLLVAAAKLHLAEDALALHLLLQRAEGLIDVVVSDLDLHVGRSSFPTTVWTAKNDPPPTATSRGRRCVSCPRLPNKPESTTVPCAVINL